MEEKTKEYIKDGLVGLLPISLTIQQIKDKTTRRSLDRKLGIAGAFLFDAVTTAGAYALPLVYFSQTNGPTLLDIAMINMAATCGLLKFSEYATGKIWQRTFQIYDSIQNRTQKS